MASEINVKQILQEYRNAYPELRTLTDEEILSVLNNAAAGVNLSADERVSMFGLNEQGYSGLGLEKQSQGQTMPDTNTLEAALRQRINKVSEETQVAEKNNSWIGKGWNWVKNTFNFGDSSNKVRDKQKEELQALNSGNIKEAFKSITGLDYTPENVNAFLNNQVKTTSEQALDGYKEGQNMASDIAGDIISGIAAVGLCSVGIATGGIGLGLGLAIVGGGLLKSGVKALDTVGTDKKYDSFGHDLITGAFSGLLAPVTGGLGGAVGKTIATRAGVQVLKHTGEKAVESGVKAMLTNPAGYQYVGGTLLKRGLAIGAEMAVDGAAGGAIDTAFRTGVEQVENGEELDWGEIGMSALQGGGFGALGAPIIGGGIRGAGKVTGKLMGKNADGAAASVGKTADLAPDDQINHILAPDEGIPFVNKPKAKPKMELPENITKLEDFLSVSKLTDSEADLILKNSGLTESQISQLRGDLKDLNHIVDALQTITKYAPDADMNINNMSPFEIVTVIREVSGSEEMSMLRFFNEDSLNFVRTYFCKENDDVTQVLIDIVEQASTDKNFYRNFNKAREISQIADAPFGGILDDLKWGYDDKFHLLTPDRIQAQAQLDKIMGNTEFSVGRCLDIEDSSKITPEFLSAFEKEVLRARKLGIDPDYGYDNPVAFLPNIKSVLDDYETKGIDLSFAKFSIYAIEKIFNGKNVHDVQNMKFFIENCSDKCKSKYLSDLREILSGSLDEKTARSYAEFFNTYAKIDLNKNGRDIGNFDFRHGPLGFSKVLQDKGITDMSGVAKLMDAFDEVGYWPSYNNFIESFNIKNGDYESAAAFIKELRELWGEISITHYGYKETDSYITYNWDTSTNFKEAINRITRLKEAGLASDVDGSLLNSILRAENPESIDKFMIAHRYGIVRNADSMLMRFIKDKTISPKQMSAVMESISSEFRKNNPILEEVDDAFLYKLVFGEDSYNIYTIHDMLYDNLTFTESLKSRGRNLESIQAEIDHICKPEFKDFVIDIVKRRKELNISEREAINILKYTNADNRVMAEKLVADTSFPREHITNLVQVTNAENITFVERLVGDSSFPREHITNLVRVTNETNLSLAEFLLEKKQFNRDDIFQILRIADSQERCKYAKQLCDSYEKLEISLDKIPLLIQNYGTFSYKDLKRLQQVVGKDKVAKLSDGELSIACQFVDIAGKTNINEIPSAGKKSMLRSLVACNKGLFEISDDMKKMFPLIPTDRETYCSLLPSIVRSLGIETNTLTPSKIESFNASLSRMSSSLEGISDADFAKLRITQDIPNETFIRTVLDKVKHLSPNERQKVYDYFGFELHHNKINETGYSITGYPVNLNNGHKLSQITDPDTKAVVEALRGDVIAYSRNNRIRCSDPQVETFLNDIAESLPEIHSMIGKKQHGAHDFDVMQHSVKVMQKISQDAKFKTLNESDKKIMCLAALMHDITKIEGITDKTHSVESAFDTFFIAKKFNLSKEEEIKLYTLCKHHEWLQYVNTAKSEYELTKRLQSAAFDLQHDNLIDMAEIFTHADLRAVKFDDSFHNKPRAALGGASRSYGEAADIYAARLREYVAKLQKSQPLLPVTKMPTAGRVKQAITRVNPDGSTNLRGVYQDKDGLVIIKYNETDEAAWVAMGLPAGSSPRGYKLTTELGEEVNTGNIKFFVHGLDYENQLAKFDAFSLVDSEVLLSVSYAERVESKYGFFRTQGVLLDAKTNYVHGGGNTDSGSGCGKFISEFKNRYIFGGERESDRLYISNLIKEATGMDDAQYVQFIQANRNKSMIEIEPVEYRDKIINVFATINSNTRKGNRAYNEMYISNPEVMGVFAYSADRQVGMPVEFVGGNENVQFLKSFALERDLPFIVFGD